MANLFWRNEQGALLTLAGTEFRTEDELETYLYANPQLLGELVIISRQMRGGSRRDIPDLVAVDADNNVVIIELKLGAASEDVIPQVLRYAIWAETNPDSIKALWLECEHKPDSMEIDWDTLSIKIMIVASEFPATVLRLVNRIRYDVELVELTRFMSGSNEFVLLNPRRPEVIPPIGPVKGRGIWDEAWYRSNYSPGSVDAFMHTVHCVEKQVQQHGWKLQTKFNKHYVGFKSGFFNVFGVEWLGSKSFSLFFKIPREVAESIRIPSVESYKYEDEWKQVVYRVEGKDYPLDKLEPLFEAAYQYITGNVP